MMIMIGLGVNESKVPLNVTFWPTAVAAAMSSAAFLAAAAWAGVFLALSSGAFMLKVKSAVFDCTASSDTATFKTVGEDSITSASGIDTDLPFIEFHILAESSGTPFAKTNSLSLIANFGKSASGVEVIRSWAIS